MSSWPWTRRTMANANANVPYGRGTRRRTKREPIRRTRNPARPSRPAEVNTSTSALGGWKLKGNRLGYHQRRPTPTIGDWSQTVQEFWNQAWRWCTLLNRLVDETSWA